ncbi:MAG: Mrp/NBP35 family ATP-binding protein [Planctomycetia bacterium]|nr:MAG: Mrp/NBP35 family ATP-binding protein [Planctomycetia bacterium]
MSNVVRDQIWSALRNVTEPNSGQDLAALGWVRNVAYCDGIAAITLQFPPSLSAEPLQRAVRQAVEAAVGRIPEVQRVGVEFALPPAPGAAGVPGVRHVIAVGAGKGGVGKSTVAVLTAFGLARAGFKVGLLDADVYGPSIPKLTSTEGAQPAPAEDGSIVPPEVDGIKVLSMGYLVAPDQPVVWRGPMAQKYVKEFLERGRWAPLDFLIVDLPPGTGDIPLTLAQSIPLSGAVVVCTPQDVALIDARRALLMYRKLGVDVLGIVENMSYYVCPHCGERDEIFSHGGAERAARELDAPFLGAIPLNVSIRLAGDAGEPQRCLAGGEAVVASAVEDVVRRILRQAELRDQQRNPLPTLTIR